MFAFCERHEYTFIYLCNEKYIILSFPYVSLFFTATTGRMSPSSPHDRSY